MKKYILIFLCLIVSCCFLGCKNDKIQFNRESKFSDVMNSIQSDKPTVRRSSGVVIYKDNSSAAPSNDQNRPTNDMNFDLPIKFK